MVFPTSDLSQENILRDIHDATTQSIRTTANAIIAPGLEVTITHTDDSVRLGDGVNFLTSTTGGGKVALDVSPSTLPPGAATSANQTTEITALGTINSTLGSPFQAGGSIGNTIFGATQSGTWNINNVSGTVSLPTGAATSANQITEITALGTINTTLGSPFQAGGSIANTSFAATQTTAANLNATVVTTGGTTIAKDSSLTTINSTLGTPMQNSGGSVTANAGTNLNTSLLAIESGGHLASIDTKVPSLGQTTASASVPVTVASDQTVVPVSNKKQTSAVSAAIDAVSSSVTYVGYASPGTATSAASWQIKKLNTSGSVTTIYYASGSAAYNQIWDNRASLSYS